MNKSKMRNELKKRTDNKIFEFFSPGRINLIGEHIDYVGGLVVPAAINLGITAYATKSDQLEIKSINFGKNWIIENQISFNVKYDSKNSFMNYVYGCLVELKKIVGKKINEKSGFKLILHSSIPISSGLSSSAAFGMLILEVMDALYNLGLGKIQKAVIFKSVENDFNGLQSGIMDQFAISLGKKNKFIKLNTSSLEYEYISAGQVDYRFILISTNKTRELIDSIYNQRVNELKQAAELIGKNFKELHKVTNDDLIAVSNTNLKKRLKHIISEVARVNSVVKNLNIMNGYELGSILNESHLSLSRDYEVSCAELDFIHNNLEKVNGILGSRMIGAGFGGCVLAIVQKDFDIKKIDFYSKYKDKFGIDFDVYEFSIEDGISVINNG